MNLTELGGWSTTCDRAFAPWAEAGFEAGRVALEHRGAYRLLTPTGELSAEIAGQFRHQTADSRQPILPSSGRLGRYAAAG